MKLLYRIAADLIFLFHAALVLVVLFGWLVPALWPAYMVLLVLTLVSDMVFGYCIVSKWEFNLRKKYNPDIEYRFAWATYYTHKLTRDRISETFYLRAATVFLVGSLSINVYFHL